MQTSGVRSFLGLLIRPSPPGLLAAGLAIANQVQTRLQADEDTPAYDWVSDGAVDAIVLLSCNLLYNSGARGAAWVIVLGPLIALTAVIGLRLYEKRQEKRCNKQAN